MAIPYCLDTVQTGQYHKNIGRSTAINVAYLTAPAVPGEIGSQTASLLGISPVVGRLSLDQEAEVRTLHPQPSPSVLNPQSSLYLPIPFDTFYYLGIVQAQIYGSSDSISRQTNPHPAKPP